jgi:hypothetical protein
VRDTAQLRLPFPSLFWPGTVSKCGLHTMRLRAIDKEHCCKL